MSRRLAAVALAAAALLPVAPASADCLRGRGCLVDRLLGFECTPTGRLICGVRDLIYPPR